VAAQLAQVVLFAEADNDTRTLYHHSATQAGWDVVAAGDGRDALVKALIRPPAVVVTELSLPLLDGFDLCEILRRDQATANIPILVVTAEARSDHLARVRRAGANGVLVKPVTADVVLDEMRRLVNAARVTADGNALGKDTAAAEATSAPVDAPQPPRRRRRTGIARETTAPPAVPPLLVCPVCDGPLEYEKSHVGGVSEQQREQWDHYLCASCGAFQYRHRTRKLRRVS
jgi:CheY-like chemotaxis protein